MTPLPFSESEWTKPSFLAVLILLVYIIIKLVSNHQGKIRKKYISKKNPSSFKDTLLTSLYNVLPNPFMCIYIHTDIYLSSFDNKLF